MPSVKRVFLFIALSCFASLWVYSQPLQQGSKTASLSGRVTVNGVPARGVSVMALFQEKGKDERIMFQLIFGGGGDFILKTTTDTNGEFRFSDLRAGEYEVFVSAPAMVGSRSPNKATAKPADAETTTTIKKAEDDQEDEDDEEEDDEDSKGNAKFTVRSETDSAKKKITLSDGETVDNIEFSITRGGVITGKVTYGDGRPVIGESVNINKKQSINDKNEYSLSLDASIVGARFTTDDRGVYRIYGVPDGRYQVSVDFRPDPIMGGRFPGQSGLHKPTYYPGVTDPAGALEVEVKNSNEIPNIDIKIGAPGKTYTVAGRVIDAETGRPIPGITIHYSPMGSSGDSGGGKSQPSNTKGQFKLEGVTSGSYAAFANADFEDESEYYGDTTNFEIKDASATGVDIKMHRGLTISGRVIIEGASNATAIAGLAEQTVFGMSWAEPQGGEKEGSLYSRAMAKVNPDGGFILKGLRPGTARVTVNSDPRGNGVFALKRTERSGVDVTSGFEIRRGETITDVVVVLARANCAIIGKVTLQGGTLPKNAQLFAFARKPGSKDDEDDSDGFDSNVGGSSAIDKDGNFKIENLVPGQYEVVVSVNVGFNEKDGTPKTREAKQIVNLAEGQELEIELVLDLTNLDD
jgi:protocatechuate 3,4-dioxygenase beta subunit